jgi:hypothetical protein
MLDLLSTPITLPAGVLLLAAALLALQLLLTIRILWSVRHPRYGPGGPIR